jgi:VWFA-related protein
MTRFGCLFLITVSCAGLLANADDTNVVFRSDVSLFRVDAQVVDRDNRALTGLRVDDFILREEGRIQQIRNFASEDMPLDVLFLLDVSASMRPHVQRIADAAHDALKVLGEDDRVAIVVFDRMARLQMPFRKGRSNVEHEMEALLRHERFGGGTDITTGMLFAARYIAKEGRREARRAIVILTDDETQRERDDAGVLLALEKADAVMSALIAPDAMGTRGYGRGGQRGGGTWPGGGPGSGGPLGGVIFGPGGTGRGGGRMPRGGGMGGSSTHSAGTSEIARRSGGDSMPVSNASALEDTLARLRQRYALHFYLPGDVRSGQQRNLGVRLTSSALKRYPDAEVRFRHTYIVPDGATPAPASAGGGVTSDPVVVTRASSEASNPNAEAATPLSTGARLKRRRAVNEDGSQVDGDATAPTEKPDVPPTAASPELVQPPPSATPKPSRGWRRVDESSGSAGPNPEPQAPKSGWPKTK